MQKSKDLLKACFENVNIVVYIEGSQVIISNKN